MRSGTKETSLVDLPAPRAGVKALAGGDWLSALAAGVAHDFHNLLLPIEILTGTIRTEPGATQALRSHLRLIEEAAERAKVLANKLDAYARAVSEERIAVDLASLLRDTFRLLKLILPSRMDFEVRLPPRPVLVRGKPSSLLGILMSLCKGCHDLLQSMPQRGVASIALGGRRSRSSGEAVEVCFSVLGALTAQMSLRALLTRFRACGLVARVHGRKVHGRRASSGVRALRWDELGLFVKGEGGRLRSARLGGKGFSFRLTLPTARAAFAASPSGPPVRRRSRSALKGEDRS